jgi:hypothetical protein
MIWLLSALAFDEFVTLAVGIALALTIGKPMMPHLPPHQAAVVRTINSSLHHPVVSLRLAASHWDRRA